LNGSRADEEKERESEKKLKSINILMLKCQADPFRCCRMCAEKKKANGDASSETNDLDALQNNEPARARAMKNAKLQ
jgi:hypothetical protein